MRRNESLSEYHGGFVIEGMFAGIGMTMMLDGAGCTNCSGSTNELYVSIARLCYHCNSSTASSEVTGMLQKISPHTRNTRSSSHIMSILNRPIHSRVSLGNRLFS